MCLCDHIYPIILLNKTDCTYISLESRLSARLPACEKRGTGDEATPYVYLLQHWHAWAPECKDSVDIRLPLQGWWHGEGGDNGGGSGSPW